MIYRSQKIAYFYFVVALLLFGLQVIMGLWLATQYFITVPQNIVDVFPFATARAMHTNLLVLWLLLGFMGATYYLVPEESATEIIWPKVAVFQLALLSLTGVVALVGFFFGWTQGRPLLEIPTPLDFVVGPFRAGIADDLGPRAYALGFAVPPLQGLRRRLRLSR